MADKSHNKTAAEYRAEAAELTRKVHESWERSDTDGFLSQWALGLGADLARRKAQLIEAGGKSTFWGLYEGDRRVAARKIKSLYGVSWLLDDAEADKFGRRFVTSGENSRIQKKLGLSERLEWRAADAKIAGSGKGLSGQAWVETYATDDKWGADAVLADAEKEG